MPFLYNIAMPFPKVNAICVHSLRLIVVLNRIVCVSQYNVVPALLTQIFVPTDPVSRPSLMMR